MLRAASLVALSSLTLTSCVSDARKAGAQIGTLNAGIDLPDLPPQCNVDTPHAPLATGQEAIVTLKRERSQLDIANAEKRICVGQYRVIQKEFERPARKASDGPLPPSISR